MRLANWLTQIRRRHTRRHHNHYKPAAELLEQRSLLTPVAIGNDPTFPEAVIHDQILSGFMSGYDDDGDMVTFNAGSPSYGTLSYDATMGAFDYTPNAGFVGADSFTFTTTDGTDGSAPATIYIDVTNTAPSATGNDVTYPEVVAHDQVLSSNLMGFDSDGDTVTFAMATGPANGTVTVNAVDGSFDYTPNAGYVGGDSFTFTVADGIDISAPATIFIDVTNTKPVAMDGTETLQVHFWETITFTVSGYDMDGDSLTYNVVPPANGTVTPGATAEEFFYDPMDTFLGTETITFTAFDGADSSDPATLDIEVINPFEDAVASITIDLNYDDDATFEAIGADLDGNISVGSNVQFEVNASLSTSWSDNYIVRLESANAETPYSSDTTINPGVPLTLDADLDIGLLAQLDLTASIIHQASGAIIGQETKNEPVFQFDLKIKSLTSHYETEKQDLKSWASELAEETAESLTETVFSEGEIIAHSNGLGLTQPEEDLAKERLTEWLRYRLETKAHQAVDEVFTLDKPIWKIRIGQNDITKPDAESIIPNLISAAGDGKSSLLLNTISVAKERAKKWGHIKYANVSDILSGEFRDSMIPAVKDYLSEGEFEPLPDPFVDPKDVPWIKEVGVKAPFAFNFPSTTVNGEFKLFLEDISYNTPLNKATFSATLKTMAAPLPSHTLTLDLGYRQSYNFDQNRWDDGIYGVFLDLLRE